MLPKEMQISDKYRHSIQGLLARAIAFDEYHLERKCERCSAEGRVEVHHINKDRDDNRRENLKILCRACHNQEHNICIPILLDIAAIKREYDKEGATLKSVGKIFGVSATCISRRLDAASWPRKTQGDAAKLRASKRKNI